MPDDTYYRPEGQPYNSPEEAIDALNKSLDKLLSADALTAYVSGPTMPHAPYPPHPHVATEMGVEGNPNCHCSTPMVAMFCMEGHPTECHAGMDCATAQCSHWWREVGHGHHDEDSAP
jgi:hypothetical protein